MTIRLNKVTRDLNVGIATIVEFLGKKGIQVEANPNAKISKEDYALLIKEYSTDKELRIESEKILQERLNRDRQKSEVVIPTEAPVAEKVEEVKTEVVEQTKPVFKQVGMIDLESLNKKKKTVIEAPIEKPVKIAKPTPPSHEVEKSQECPVIESKQEDLIESTPVKPIQPVLAIEKEEMLVPPLEKQTQPEVTLSNIEKESPIETPQNEKFPVKEELMSTDEVEDKDGVFKIRTTEFESKINVVGRIDLSTINQSTRPKKKSKEEKKKEREEKIKVVPDKKPPVIATAATIAAAAEKKKRSRIRKDKVDVTKEVTAPALDQKKSSNLTRPVPNSERKKNPQVAAASPNRVKGPNATNNNANRFKQPQIKVEVSDEDVAKQVKETLARLTTKTKNKGAQHRKDKREAASKNQQDQADQQRADGSVLKLTEFVTASELANMMDVSVIQIIATCMSIGMMVSINQRLDAETINIVAEEFGFKTEYVSADVSEAIEEEVDREEDLLPRAPIVTVMGHVDHGKTSLLDAIRKTNVIAGEAGGITQHIGAYNVKLPDGRPITFLDTPGHEAFTAMRARGARVTDIAIIIVAADDNVMPQTIEAINHASAAGVPMIFAINKCDKSGANPEKIKETLAQMNYLVEDWGGKYQSQDISAKQNLGINELLEKILLEAEVLDLKANPNKRATGSIIESTLDKGRGHVSTVLVSNGTLKAGDIVLAGTYFGRVKAMFNERNQRITEAAPSAPALILGLGGAPQAGDAFHVMETEQQAREIANKREQLQREQGLRTQKILTLDEVGRRIALGNFQELNIIVKGDVDGSIEALSDSLINLSTHGIQVNVIHKAVGQISESDVTLAAASNAIIIGFQVRPSVSARQYAEREGVDVRLYSIIYDALEEVKAAMEGMLSPEIKEEITATIEVREVFKITKVGTVAGAIVKEGKVKRGNKARLIRDGIVIFTGEINALKRFKDDVKEVGTNYECGISLVNYHNIEIGDMIESFELTEIKGTL